MKITDETKTYAAVFVLSMAAYILTLCPTVYAGDAGDFITASHTLGVAHPTGYPLYMIAGKAFSYLPVGTVAYRYNLMSAVFAAASSVIACAITYKITKSLSASAGAALMLSFSQALWEQAVVAETYSINLFFFAAATYLALKWRKDKTRKTFTTLFFTYGLGLTNHVSLLVYVPAFLYLLHDARRKILGKMSPEKSVLALLSPLLLYLYIPFRAASNKVHNWGRPDDVQTFISHVTGSVHRQTYAFSLGKEDMFERFFGIVYHFSRQFSLAAVLPLAGLYKWGGKDKPFLKFTGLVVAADLVYALFLNDVNLQITTFGLPSIMLFSIWSGHSLKEAGDWAQKKWSPQHRILPVAAIVLFVFASNYHISDRSDSLLAYDFGMNILRTVEDDAIVFAEGDNTVLPLTYLLNVEGAKPGVKLVDRHGFLSHDVYGEDYVWLEEGEHLLRQANTEYAIINSTDKPIYYTTRPEIDFPGYEVTQVGLIYRLTKQGQEYEAPKVWGAYDMRGVWEPTGYVDYMNKRIRAGYYLRLAESKLADDPDEALQLLVEARDIVPENTEIHYDIGNILLRLGQYGEAAQAFRKVLAENPDDYKAHNNLGYAYSMMQYWENARQHYVSSLKLEPTYLKARYNLAGMLMSQQLYAQAIEQYQFIVNQNPQYASAYLYMGVAYYRSGEYAGAANAWEKYLQLRPDDPRADEIRQQLEEIKGALEQAHDYIMCADDTECDMTPYQIGECCPDRRCRQYAINEKGLMLQKQWRTENCNETQQCPELECEPKTLQPVCAKNTCRLTEQ